MVLGLMAQIDTNFPEVRRMLLYFSRFILEHFWPTSKLLHGHIALAIPSLPETDPQILEHYWVYADEDYLNKSFQAMDSGLECQCDVQRLFCEFHTSDRFPYV